MTISIENLFHFIVLLFDLFIAVLVLQLSFRKKLDASVWLLFCYCLFNSLTNFVSEQASNKFNYYLYALFTLIEYSVFAYFIFSNIRKKMFRRIIFYASVSFLAFNIFHTLTSKQKGLDSVPIAIETILLFLFCFYYLYIQMSEIEETFIYNQYQFWIIIGIMVYLGGSFFIYIFANIETLRRTIHEFWFLTYVFYIIKNVLFAIGIFFLRQKAKTVKSNDLYSYLN